MHRLPDINQLAELVIATARQELLPRFGKVPTQCKADGSLVSHADLAVQQVLSEKLSNAWPQYSLLSEEQPEEMSVAALENIQQGVWCLDPLDGTSNFVAGIPYYAVSLALIVGDRVAISVVYDPARDECFTAVDGQGACLNKIPLNKTSNVTALHEAIALVDFKRLPVPLRQQLAGRAPYKSQRSFGAVALDWCWLAAGRVQLYLHGQQKLWDYAAGQLILCENQGHACTLEGEAVFVANLQPRSALAALNTELFNAWRLWIENNS